MCVSFDIYTGETHAPMGVCVSFDICRSLLTYARLSVAYIQGLAHALMGV